METKNLAIDALRLPLIILVVFIHMNPTFDSVGYWGLTINTIAQVAVPCFFVIAGYFFVGNKPLTLEMYKVKLKKRVVTLLIPYLLWNLVPSLVLIGGNLFSIVFRGKSTEDLMTFLTDLWNDGVWHLWWDKVNGMPSDSPLWFLRDLIVMCVLAPVFYYFIKKGGKLAVVIWFLLYVFLPVSWAHLPGISITAVFFFNIGLYLRYNGIDLVGGSNRMIVISLGLSQMTSATKVFNFNLPISNMQTTMLLCASMCVFCQQVILFPPRKIWACKVEGIFSKLADFSYSLYLIHRILLLVVFAFFFNKEEADLSFVCLMQYTAIVLGIMLVTYVIYYVTEKRTALVKRIIKKQLRID